MRKTILTTIVLMSTLTFFGQTDQPAEKIEKELNLNWTNSPKWNYIENGKQFSFVKKGVAKLETCKEGLSSFLDNYSASNYQKLSKVNNSERNAMFQSAEKYFIGATILNTPNDTIGDYIKLIDIPETDKFVVIATTGITHKYKLIKKIRREKPDVFISSKIIVDYKYDSETLYYSGNDESYKATKATKLLIQNLSTKLYYVLNLEAFEFSYGQCDNLRYDVLAQIYKITPKVSTQNEQALITKYKSLIKSANSDIVVLQSIQKKYTTRGYFDPSKVNAIDKKTYNSKLAELKTKAKKLADIDSYEDKDDKAQDKLTTSELGSLNTINEWNYNVYKLN